MTIIGTIIFVFCFWAVFSHHFCDGIIAKHLLTFSAIAAAIMILDPKNYGAAIGAVIALVGALVYWAFKHRHLIARRLRVML